MRIFGNRASGGPAVYETSVDKEARVAREIAQIQEMVPLTLRETASRYIEFLRQIRLMLLVPQPLKAEEEKLKGMAAILERVARAFQAGFDVTTPNDKWFCGVTSRSVVETRDGWTNPDAMRNIRFLFPSVNSVGNQRAGQRDVLVFCGIIPVEVQRRLIAAEEIFGKDHIQIYAPQQSYFESPTILLDPVMIGVIENVPDQGNLYFEIARWDTKKDLEGMKSP